MKDDEENDEEVGKELLHAWGLTSRHEAVPALIERYSGHPLALRLIATTVQELFAGDMGIFFADGPLLFDDLRRILDAQCARLSTLEKEIMLWLAVKSEPMSFQTLWDSLSRPHHARLSWKPCARCSANRCLMRLGMDLRSKIS